MSFIALIFHVEQIENAEADRALIAWEHKMGPCAPSPPSALT